MFNKILAAIAVSSALLSGCATTDNTTMSSHAVSVTRIEKYIIPGTSTLKDVREILGAPTIAGKTLQGQDFVGYNFVGEKNFGRLVGQAFASAFSFGIAKGVDDKEHTQRAIFFSLEGNDHVVTDIKYDGYTYINRHRSLFSWTIASRRMKPEEVRDTKNYNNDEIEKLWKDFIVNEKPADVQKIADNKGVNIEEIEVEDVKYGASDPKDYLKIMANLNYGEYSDEEINFYKKAEPYDSTKEDLFFNEDTKI